MKKHSIDSASENPNPCSWSRRFPSEAGEYSGLSGNRWIAREFVAGQAGPQGRCQARLCIMLALEEIVKLN